MVTKDSIIRINKNVSISEIDGEKIMIDFDSGKYFMIKGVGNDIWDRIQSEVSVEDLIKGLLSEYDIDENTCEADVINFLNKLAAHDFLQIN